MDQFSEQYQDLIEDSYDCVDRIVLNAYFAKGQDPGGMRVWWRDLYGSDEELDTNHLMRMAGRFSRRVHAYAKAAGIPVRDCAPKEKKFEIAEEYLAKRDSKTGAVPNFGGQSTSGGLGGTPDQSWQDWGHPPQEALAFCEPLLVPHLGCRVGPYHHQDERPPSVWGTDNSQWP